jgi:1,4-alpha-glucan branching enzyme
MKFLMIPRAACLAAMFFLMHQTHRACAESAFNSMAPLGVFLEEGGATFRVWAPNASEVTLVGDFNEWSEQVLVEDRNTGYWSGFAPGAKADEEYQYVIYLPGNERGRRKNDPRADWIRNGHSVIYDHAAFKWGEGFIPRHDTTGLVYELHIGAFYNPSPKTNRVATFDDAIRKLDYLEKLGVDIIALMPINEYLTATSWGYNPEYLFAVEHDYGGPDGLKRFVKAAHARGIKVQLDIVHNHYVQEDYPAEGPGLVEFDGPEDIYFYGRVDSEANDPDQEKRAAHKWGPRPDYSQPEVRRYIRDNVRHWLEKYRIDGFRWDSPKNILGYASDGTSADPDTLLPEALQMMRGINRMIREEYPGRTTIAEEPNLMVVDLRETVWTEPQIPAAGQPVTVYYKPVGRNLEYKANINIHYGYNENKPENWSELPGYPMVNANGTWSFTYTVPQNATIVRYAFNDGNGTWDNNTYRDWCIDFFNQQTVISDAVESFDGHWQGAFCDSILSRLNGVGPDVFNLLLKIMNFPQPPGQRVIFTDNHDYAGDLNNEKRVPHKFDEANPNSLMARRKSLMAATLTFTAPGSPMLLMGQEFHATGSFTDRLPMDWSAAAENWRLFQAYKDLADLRNSHPSIRNTNFSQNYGFHASRWSGRFWRGEDVCVIFNSGSIAQNQITFRFPSAGEWHVALNTDDLRYGPDSTGFFRIGDKILTNSDANGNHYATMNLAPYSAIIFTKTPLPPAHEDADDNALPDALEILTNGNPDSVFGDFNYWDRFASPLIPLAVTDSMIGRMQFFPESDSGSFEGFVKGNRIDGGYFYSEARRYLYFTVENGVFSQVEIDPLNPSDADGNGLDDRWEMHYGATAADGDEDGDGLTNLMEFRRGSDPLQVNRSPALVGNKIPLGWTPEAPDLKMTWSLERDRWEWIGEFLSGQLEFKFATGPGWRGENYGKSMLEGKTDLTGGDLVWNFEKSGRYRIHFNEIRNEFSVELFEPLIVLENSDGSPLLHGDEIPFGAILLDSSPSLITLTLKNLGNDSLTDLTMIPTGSHEADFVMVPPIESSIPPGGSVTFSVNFSPLEAGNRMAQLSIASNDPNHNPFILQLSGFGLSTSLDSDGDGLNDAAEYHMAALGFDWSMHQPELVGAYAAGANADGRFSREQIQVLNISTPLISKNEATGNFELILGLQKSSDLETFHHFSLHDTEISVEQDGRLKIHFNVPDNAAFFRLQAE